MLLVHATLVTMQPPGAAGQLDDGAMAIEGGRIVWIGASDQVPQRYRTLETIDVSGRLVTPGLIDCHTHLVHGGDRANEFEMRLNGASYQQVARAGGGIVSTVAATRSSSPEELSRQSLRRVDHLIAEGVTTVEIKSGYGLDVETELKMLQVAKQMETLRRLRVKTSFLGAHAVPPEFRDRSDDYLKSVCLPAMTEAHRQQLVDAVDGFCEGIAFSATQMRNVFERAAELGLPVKLHAEQLSHQGGAQLVAEFGGLSADHLEYATEQDAIAMSEAGTTAVLLPGAFYTLRETRLPPVDAFRKHNVPMAVATDANPGSSPLTSILLAMNMACTLFRLTPDEALAGVTVHAAKALGISDAGVLAPGFQADLAIWDVQQPAELAYRIGFNPLWKRVVGGQA